MSKKIAVIEDDADLFALLKYNLSKEGFAVVGAQTGRGATELCRREKPDLVLLDIMLPDADGLEICKSIRAHAELAHIPVIFLTARLLKAASLELDRSSCEVRLDGSPLTLTATEFRLLEFLMTRPGVVFSREQLLDSVWGHDRAVTDRTVDVYILRLRQKIEADPANPALIRSVRGFGYSFNVTAQPVEESEQRATLAAQGASTAFTSAG